MDKNNSCCCKHFQLNIFNVLIDHAFTCNSMKTVPFDDSGGDPPSVTDTISSNSGFSSLSNVTKEFLVISPLLESISV